MVDHVTAYPFILITSTNLISASYFHLHRHLAEVFTSEAKGFQPHNDLYKMFIDKSQVRWE